ncbi:galactokinase [Meredithblackwellia eburnea MCA 4105]
MPYEPIPLRKSLDEVYTKASLLKQGKRWDELATKFKDHFKVQPQKVARAPGRVNVIGEHIDYCGFSVLPAAIERDVLIAFTTVPSSDTVRPPSPGRTMIHLRNLDPTYTPVELQVNLLGDGSDLTIDSNHHWSNYFIAGATGMLGYLYFHPAFSTFPTPPAHVYIMVSGTVPLGSGLSSSSALTVASAVTFLELLDRRDGGDRVGRRATTEVAIESERLVGVNSGGMDQSASVFSQPNHLIHIEFLPQLSAQPIPFPSTQPPLSFVIANTLVTSNKAETSKFNYNLRVVETRLGARLLATHLNVPLPDLGEPQISFKALLDQYFHSPPPAPGPHPEDGNTPTHLPISLPTVPALPTSPLAPVGDRMIHQIRIMLAVAATALGGPGLEEGETWEAVAEKLGEEKEELEDEVVGKSEIEPVNGRLKIWRRARHVLTEALRVYQFKALLESAPSDDAELLASLGKLMNESQASCRDDFECSCPEIDEVVDLALKNGALGSRLTGAGWGGSTVSLVPEPQVPQFIKAIREGYYAKRFPNLTEEELDDVCFATKPEAGACVVQLFQ